MPRSSALSRHSAENTSPGASLVVERAGPAGFQLYETRWPKLARKPKKRGAPRWMTLALVLGVGGVAAIAIYSQFGAGGASPPTYPTYSAEQVALGEQAFQANCATCHGVTGAGDARAGVPALNGSMHAWHHPDSQIAGLIRQGGMVMPAIGPDWSDEQITAVLAYIKEWWQPQQRATQARISGG